MSLISPSNLASLLSASEDAACPQSPQAMVGGQALMEGVMMRNGDRLAIAVRRPAGDIVAECRSWFSIKRGPVLKRPWIKGFIVLVETLVNGIKALNRSAVFAAETKDGESGDLKSWQLLLTMGVAIVFAVGLFVVLPHLFSLFMQWIGVSGGVEGLSFHIWDGLFKFCIFLGYILAISFLPDIRRVFQYHGAEHKVIHAFESKGTITPTTAALNSRLHPRCGTTFLLFVLSISIIVHAIAVPLLFKIWTPDNAVLKHVVALLFKLALIIPISSAAYELIRFAARLKDGLAADILRMPGLVLQRLTTYEPDESQLEVAIVALREALGAEAPESLVAPAYTLLSDGGCPANAESAVS